MMAAFAVGTADAQLTVDGNLSVVEDQETLDGVVFYGTFDGSSTIPVTGAGTRFMWYPKKAALRAGKVTGTQWDDGNIGEHSVALGFNTRARSASSVALGHGTVAWSGTGSVALGSFAWASGEAAIAAGQWSTVYGSGSVALGIGSEIDGSNYSFAAGAYNWIEGEDNAVAIGRSNTVFGADAIAIGRTSHATAESAIALGRFVRSNVYGMLAVGLYNELMSGSSDSWVGTDPLFVIGNGTAFNERSNAMVVYKNADTELFGNLEVAGTVRIQPSGDIGMGQFTSEP